MRMSCAEARRLAEVCSLLTPYDPSQALVSALGRAASRSTAANLTCAADACQALAALSRDTKAHNGGAAAAVSAASLRIIRAGGVEAAASAAMMHWSCTGGSTVAVRALKAQLCATGSFLLGSTVCAVTDRRMNCCSHLFHGHYRAVASAGRLPGAPVEPHRGSSSLASRRRVRHAAPRRSARGAAGGARASTAGQQRHHAIHLLTSSEWLPTTTLHGSCCWTEERCEAHLSRWGCALAAAVCRRRRARSLSLRRCGGIRSPGRRRWRHRRPVFDARRLLRGHRSSGPVRPGSRLTPPGLGPPGQSSCKPVRRNRSSSARRTGARG